MINTITINGLTIGTVASGYLIQNLSGFGFPEIDVNVKERGSYHGAKLAGYRYSRRVLNIELQIVGNDIGDFEDKRRALEQALTIMNGLTEVTFLTKDGVSVVADCILNSAFDAPYKSGQAILCDAQIQLVAPFPYFLGASNNVDVNVAVGGGFAIPYSIPLSMVTGGTGATTIANDGNGEAYPIFTLTGTLENPSIYNETTGKVLSVAYTLSTISDTIVIDTYNRTAVLNSGANVKSYVSGDFWTLHAGNNVVKLTSANASDDGSVNITFNDSYLGL